MQKSHIQRKRPSFANKYFNKIFVINLADQGDRLKKIKRRFNKHKIDFERFIAVDGRCKGARKCNKKRKEFEKLYGVEIPEEMDLPPASLTLGTVLILREMVRNGWKRIAIFEDDATILPDFEKRLRAGTRELEKVAPDWDVLYLGCTQYCGSRGISIKKTKKNKYLSSIHKFNKNAKFYVSHKDDIRIPCDPEECKPLSKNLSVSIYAAGGFGYAISQKGARKILDIIDNNIDDHMDGILPDAVDDGNLYAVGFDPPIVGHFGGAERSDTTLEWDWEV